MGLEANIQNPRTKEGGIWIWDAPVKGQFNRRWGLIRFEEGPVRQVFRRDDGIEMGWVRDLTTGYFVFGAVGQENISSLCVHDEVMRIKDEEGYDPDVPSDRQLDYMQKIVQDSARI